MIVSFFNAIWLGFSNHTWAIVGGFIIIWLVLIAMYFLGAVLIGDARKMVTGVLGSISVLVGALGLQIVGVITPVYIVLVFISWILRLAS